MSNLHTVEELTRELEVSRKPETAQQLTSCLEQLSDEEAMTQEGLHAELTLQDFIDAGGYE